MSRILIATLIVISALSPRQDAFAGDHPAQFPAAAGIPSSVLQAFEFESLFPMFISGGYHFCIAYRYEQFRVRLWETGGDQ